MHLFQDQLPGTWHAPFYQHQAPMFYYCQRLLEQPTQRVAICRWEALWEALSSRALPPHETRYHVFSVLDSRQTQIMRFRSPPPSRPNHAVLYNQPHRPEEALSALEKQTLVLVLQWKTTHTNHSLTVVYTGGERASITMKANK